MAQVGGGQAPELGINNNAAQNKSTAKTQEPMVESSVNGTVGKVAGIGKKVVCIQR